ncbi:hypothetical protein [Cohnella nanjingensis]|uniref:Uncharacterized protein n=1 Tax=Cohnella nanjingensis TaxID=1387779 RepID=A0A7X0RRJ8_9BACL|nr:hypothetical protein [Cohnella nanjingensis]MBB6672216.1 hypothetical protein [Cohnella nanjingensis]
MQALRKKSIPSNKKQKNVRTSARKLKTAKSVRTKAFFPFGFERFEPFERFERFEPFEFESPFFFRRGFRDFF